MVNDHYKECLLDSIKKLIETRDALFLSVFNLAMMGELKEWNNSVQIGETYEFSKEVFEGCADKNIQLLTSLMNYIENRAITICNTNSIDIQN